MADTGSLARLVADELAQPVDPRVEAMAVAIAAQHLGAARAVLFYGSCLRESQLDGLMLDFYLIVSDYADAYDRRWLATANRLIPPNVFPFEHAGLMAKYAVLSEADFAALNRAEASNVSVWARFAQPSRLVWTAGAEATALVVAAVAEAPMTLFQLTLPVLAPDRDWTTLDIWREGFARTYRAELRAERQGRSGSIVDTDPERYVAFGMTAHAEIAWRMGVGPNGEVPLYERTDRMQRRWRRLQWRGKALSVIRLAKAAFTYAGGIDYLAWKINRHAGTAIVIQPWQRRFPLLAALVLLPRLLRSGAIR